MNRYIVKQDLLLNDPEVNVINEHVYFYVYVNEIKCFDGTYQFGFSKLKREATICKNEDVANKMINYLLQLYPTYKFIKEEI